MAKNVFDFPHKPSGPLPDVSELHTSLLRPHQQTFEMSAQQISEQNAEQIAQHEAALQDLVGRITTVEGTITGLSVQMRSTTDPGTRQALEHNRADLECSRYELHRRWIGHLRSLARLQLSLFSEPGT